MASRRAVASDGPNCFPDFSDRNPLCALLSTRRALCGPRLGCARGVFVRYRPARMYRRCTVGIATPRNSLRLPFRQWRQARERQQSIRRSAEKPLPICRFVRRAVLLAWRAVGGGDKKRSVACRVNSDVGREPGSAAGLLDDVRRIVVLTQVHPTESDTRGLARVIEAENLLETRSQLVNRMGGVRLRSPCGSRRAG